VKLRGPTLAKARMAAVEAIKAIADPHTASASGGVDPGQGYVDAIEPFVGDLLRAKAANNAAGRSLGSATFRRRAREL
jgi:hypothetical protein